MRELRDILREFSKAVENMALATIVRTQQGSYPRSKAPLSIIAEIQAVMNDRDGGFLRNRKETIHHRSPCPVSVQ